MSVLTVTENIDSGMVAHWTVRDGRTVVARVSEPQTHGMWDTGKVVSAVATALSVDESRVRPVRGTQPKGFRHYVSTRFLSVES